jgi:ribosome modulation factor
MSLLEHLDDIAREAWAGDYRRVGPLSKGERLYVGLASGRMRELCPDDSIAYAVNRVGPEWMAHMLNGWRAAAQPSDKAKEE